MSLARPTGVPDLYLVDTQQLGMARYGAAFLLKTAPPAIVETGMSYSAPHIVAALRELGIAPESVAYIFPTHVHLDHAGGAGVLARDFCPQAKVVVHERGAPHLAEPERLVRSVARAVGVLFERYGTAVPIPPERLLGVSGGEVFELGAFTLEVIEAPGHAPHQYVLFERNRRALFVGDACGIYREEVGRLLPTTPPPAFHLEESLKTLKALKARRPEVLLFTHFGAFRRPDLLDEYAALLGRWTAEVTQALDELGDAEAVVPHLVRKLTPTLQGYDDEVMVRQEIEMNVQGVLLYLKRRRSG